MKCVYTSNIDGSCPEEGAEIENFMREFRLLPDFLSAMRGDIQSPCKLSELGVMAELKRRNIQAKVMAV